MFEDIDYEASGGVATITLNRPAKLNALRMQTYEELATALRAAGADETAGVVVVRGAGRAFCAGGDLEMAQTMLTSEHAGREHFFGRMIDCSNAVLTLGKPVVCWMVERRAQGRDTTHSHRAVDTYEPQTIAGARRLAGRNRGVAVDAPPRLERLRRRRPRGLRPRLPVHDRVDLLPRGGHFAPAEVPELVVDELRGFLGLLRA